MRVWTLHIVGIIFLSSITHNVYAAINSEPKGKGILTVRTQIVEGGTIPQGASNVPMLSLRFQASCDADISVSSITLSDDALGYADDIASLFLMEDGVRITRARKLSNSSISVTFSLKEMVVKRCTERSLVLMANFSRTAITGAEHRFTVEYSSDIISSAISVELTNELEGEPVSIGTVTQGKVAIRFLIMPERLQFGNQRTIARLQIHADEVSDHYIDRMTLTNEEDARSANIQNISLETLRGVPVTFRVKQMIGNEIRLVFEPPLLIQRSETILLNLKADAFTSLRKVHFTLKEPSDIKIRKANARRL